MQVECRLCRWHYPCNSTEHGEHLLTLHLKAAHTEPETGQSLVNRCLAAMAAFPWEVQRDAARHVLGDE